MININGIDNNDVHNTKLTELLNYCVSYNTVDSMQVDVVYQPAARNFNNSNKHGLGPIR